MGKTIKIEKGIPIPVRLLQGGCSIAGTIYPLKDMKIGDSIPVPAKDITPFRSILAKIHRTLKIKFTTRKIDNSYRCWRIE